MGIVRGPLKSVTAAAPPGASGKNEPHHIAAAATTNLLPDFTTKSARNCRLPRCSDFVRNRRVN
jgi:hypothetical protein